MDVNEKPVSKFPRSSLRASNKTMIVSSSDAQKLRLESAREQIVAHQTVIIGGDEQGLDEPVPERSANDVAGLAELGLEESFEEQSNPPSSGGEEQLKSSDISEDDVLGEIFSGLDDALDAVEPEQVLKTAIQAADQEQVGMLSESESLQSAEVLNGVDHSFAHAAEVSIAAMTGAPSGVASEHKPGIQTARKECVQWRRPSKLIGFLVSFDDNSLGSYVELREGRLVVSSDSNSSENCLVIADESVSPMHAIIRIGGDGNILILDQLSENGTRIKRVGDTKEEALMGDKSSLGDGDMVIFGECAYHVCIIKRAGN
jgi:hypothetical protein